MKNVAIEMKNVSRKFVSPTGKITLALRDFSLTVHEGDFIAIVGPTGCGKSTTLGMITGLNPPSSGSVKVFGKSVQGIDPNIGFVFQADAVFPWKSVIDNVAIGPIFRGTDPKIAHDMAADWIRRVGLTGFEHHYPHQLSGGMRKRVALAQTFINEPKILLMDEPFSALDVQTRALMQEELLGLWSEKKASVIFVTHDIEEAIALADRVIVLSKGPGSVKSSYEIPLARPRDISEARYSDEFVHLSKQIWSDLKDEVQI
ncbi:ABC transporter ATP-binding protein [Undibacterium griseum]|uniref:ABC transporter ATP-binding protein n=1 Tax=Undibacterium griseum TaxID=2762295 RepID=A0ABR6YP97_9BURK|nr:ABC transporter ATP-binding protein [Undibacterium griseum]MBC3885723.1 ABC transporter ATP-binding protein [Undibacterium griseum]